MSTDHTVTARYDTVFHHAYAVEQPDLRRLYEQAKRDQWNVSRDIDWSRPVDLDSAVVADELIDIYGTPYWERLGPRERAELNRRFTAWRLSVLLYGEHGRSEERRVGKEGRAGSWPYAPKKRTR